MCESLIEFWSTLLVPHIPEVCEAGVDPRTVKVSPSWTFKIMHIEAELFNILNIKDKLDSTGRDVLHTAMVKALRSVHMLFWAVCVEPLSSVIIGGISGVPVCFCSSTRPHCASFWSCFSYGKPGQTIVAFVSSVPDGLPGTCAAQLDPTRLFICTLFVLVPSI